MSKTNLSRNKLLFRLGKLFSGSYLIAKNASLNRLLFSHQKPRSEKMPLTFYRRGNGSYLPTRSFLHYFIHASTKYSPNIFIIKTINPIMQKSMKLFSLTFIFLFFLNLLYVLTVTRYSKSKFMFLFSACFYVVLTSFFYIYPDFPNTCFCQHLFGTEHTASLLWKFYIYSLPLARAPFCTLF